LRVCDSDWSGGVGDIPYTLRGGTPSFTHYNRRGDVTAKTDATGTVTYQATYKAFGERATETGSTADRQKSNTKDEDIPGYANEGFRFRDLETGVFLTRDPIGSTLMQPGDKWFVDGAQVKQFQYARAALPRIVDHTDRDPTNTALKTAGQSQEGTYGEAKNEGLAERGFWHIAEPGQPNIYSYVSNNPWTKFDPEGLYESPSWMRTFVPGTVAYDAGVTAVENGNYGRAAGYFGVMLGEQFLFVLTIGEGSAALQGGKAVTAATTRSQTLVQFGANANQTYHAERHIQKLGISVAAVKKEIMKDLKNVADQVPSAGKPLNRVVEVAGKKLQYTAYKLSNGKINIGRIHEVKKNP